MKTSFTLMVFAAVVFYFSSCNTETGEGNIITETREVGNFDKIELSNASQIEIVKGDTVKVEVSDYENLLEYLVVETVNNKLIVKTEPLGVWLRNSRAKVKVTMPDELSSLILSGSGDIDVYDSFPGITDLHISGSGSIHVNPANFVSPVSAIISGSGSMEMSGIVSEINTSIPGSGSMYFGNLRSQDAVCNISGSGNITIWAEQSLEVNISGSGNIYYYGSPDITSNITGSGRIIKK